MQPRPPMFYGFYTIMLVVTFGAIYQILPTLSLLSNVQFNRSSSVIYAQEGNGLYLPVIAGGATGVVTPTVGAPVTETPTFETSTPETPTPETLPTETSIPDASPTETPTPETPTPIEQLFSIAIGDQVSPNEPEAGAGNIATDNQRDLYTFEAVAGQGVFFDEISDHDCAFIPTLFWKLSGPDGGTLFDESFGGTTLLGASCDAGLYRLAEVGTYTLTVYGSPTDYVFALTEAPADLIDIEFDELITNGSPQPGAGNIEASYGKDIYRFTASPGQRIYIEFVGIETTVPLDWALYDGSHQLVYYHCVRFFCDVFDPGVLTLAEGGTYYLEIGNNAPDSTGTYYLTVWAVPEPQQFQISIGDSVTEDSVGTGSGRIENPSYQDAYEFTATPGQQVYLFKEDFVQYAGFNFKLVDDEGNVIVRTCALLDFSCPGGYGDPGVQTLRRGGKYQLIVGNEGGTLTGTYRFTLLNVPPPQHFDIKIGDKISNGIPGVGAGNIESPDVKDIYHFTAEAGQKVFFEFLPKDFVGPGGIGVVIDRVNETVYNGCMDLCSPPGVVTFVHGGTYTITIGSNAGLATGTYEFQSWTMPPPQSFDIAIGDDITDGYPANGAGNLETPGAKDIYRFTATPGQRIQLQVDPVNLTGELPIELRDQVQTVATYCVNGICGVPPIETLRRGGNYQLILGASDRIVTGTYHLKLWQPTATQEFNIQIGDKVSNGIPVAGAGNIESPQVQDIYHFNATAGQTLYFDEGAEGACEGEFGWKLEGPDGNARFDDWLGGDCDVGSITLDQTGAYRIVVYPGAYYTTGTYSFELRVQ